MEWIRRETIGRGSFSTVSLATTSENTTTFPSLMAVKSSGVVCSAALMNEKHVLDELGDCSEIVRCFGEEKTVENGEEIYNLFLEYASGGNLADRVKKSGGSLPEFEVRRFTRSIVKGLCHIHKNGYSHCDLKLENILVFGNGDDVKISDFGLAKGKSDDEISRFEIRGTPLYMAPECVNHGEFETPADIWGLGCCVVEMCSGKTVWCFDESDDAMSLMIRIGSGEEAPRVPEELSEEGKDFVRKCFVRNAAERWTAHMLLDHPFLDGGDEVEEGCCLVGVSPRDPFDFPGWDSVQSPVMVSSLVVRLPKDRISGLVSEMVPDWSVSCDWANVR